MEHPGDEGADIDQSGAGSDLHGDQTKQATLGSDCDQDEGQGPQSQRRAVQMQMEKPRHSLQGMLLYKSQTTKSAKPNSIFFFIFFYIKINEYPFEINNIISLMGLLSLILVPSQFFKILALEFKGSSVFLHFFLSVVSFLGVRIAFSWCKKRVYISYSVVMFRVVRLRRRKP